jgi:hypothetical protein
MRGDNVTTTNYTDNNLRKLASFTATTANEYDSAYVYYHIINNCNYYIAHRDTALYTGSTNVVIHEYAAIKAVRAWAYLQLARSYGKVPFFTEPLTKISQINKSDYPELDLNGIVAALAPDLEQYTGYNVPDYGSIAAGSTNWGQSKTVYSQKCFIPVDIILGDLYLEDGQYDNAAKHYTTYLTKIATETNTPVASYSIKNLLDEPSDFSGTVTTTPTWESIFNNNSTTDIISYIPMAVNRLRGKTTKVPEAFGYNYYSTSSSSDELYDDEIQIEPSDNYMNLADTARYYYYSQTTTSSLANSVCNSAILGDMRARTTLKQGDGEDSTKIWVRKYLSGNIVLYRMTTVWLHLAEALNRMGYPDAAFAILKDGVQEQLLDSTTYLTQKSKKLFQTTCPFLSSTYVSKFSSTKNTGIHAHGAGVTSDGAYPGRSPYQYNTILGQKLQQIASDFKISVGTTKEDSINAMEDILCDEYQLEFAFEGSRWPDLMRLAKHKNQAGTYSANFGNQWLARKLSYKGVAKDLTDQNNWYLPFK